MLILVHQNPRLASHNIPQLVDHLFRHESGKLVAVLTGTFGIGHLELAEDVVQDSLVEALTHWRYEGLPDDPSAWLFRVAKNKALNILNRRKYHRKYIAEATTATEAADTAEPVTLHLPSDQEIQDDQLRMIFTCCHPAISPDSQIALALKTLCSFSIAEIARAFLTSEATITKRLKRARQSIRDAAIPFEIPRGKDLAPRVSAVLETIYLLFNEGYSASKGDDLIRYELCEEAIHLARIVATDRNIRHKENAEALLALMFLNASRFRARQDNEGTPLTMAEQDRSLWDGRLRDTGLQYLSAAATNDAISAYHLMAAISAQHCIAPDYESTDWDNILSLYDSLILLDHSPVVSLNRAIALAKVKGPEAALAELDHIGDEPAMGNYYLFHSTQAEFFIQANDQPRATAALKKAIQMAPIPSIKNLLKRKLNHLPKTI